MDSPLYTNVSGLKFDPRLRLVRAKSFSLEPLDNFGGSKGALSHWSNKLSLFNVIIIILTDLYQTVPHHSYTLTTLIHYHTRIELNSFFCV